MIDYCYLNPNNARMRMKLFPFLLLLVSSQLHAQQPNIIYIMSDDHDADAISAYNKKLINTPNLDRIAKGGMRFSNCFVGNSICSPVRATTLTGQHSHKNGVKDNRTPFDSSKVTVPKLMRAAGYQTALIGKWHLHTLPSGFDFWRILPGQGLYYDTRFIRMSKDTVTINGYATDLITDEAINWLRDRDKSKPFFLMLHHKAPHRNFHPSLRWLEEWHNKKIPEPPTLHADTVSKGTAWKTQKMGILEEMRICTDLKVDPAYIMDIPWLKPDSTEINNYRITFNRIPEPDRSKMKAIYSERGKMLQSRRPQGKELLTLKYQWYMQDYLACVASIDENIGRVLDYLDANALNNNTIVIYTSDQGFFLGENGWFDKRFMYDISMNTPLMVKWDGKIKAGSTNNTLVQNIDFGPTMLGLAGVSIPSFMQGINLKDLLLGKQKTIPRKSLYYHYYEYPWDHNVLPHLGIRQERYKLIYFYTVNEWELYDLKTDPNEQKNLINLKHFQIILNRLKKELQELRKFYDDTEAAGELK